LSLATICSGNLRWDQRGTFSPLSVTNCIHNLICVSTRDLAPVSGTPRTLICSFLQSHICWVGQDMRDLSRVYFKALKNNSAYFESNDWASAVDWEFVLNVPLFAVFPLVTSAELELLKVGL
jgi:hypothetical protein